MIQIKSKDMIISYVSYFLKFGTSVILTPLIVYFLPSQDLGLWYTFASIAYVVDLIDLGFNPNLSRNLTFAWSGAKELVREGVPANKNEDGSPNYELFGIVFKTCRLMRQIMSALSAVALLTAGTAYVLHTMRNYDATSYLLPWLIYTAAIVCGYFYGYWSVALNAIGKIAEGQKAVLYSKISQLLFTTIFLFAGMGLNGVCLAYFACGWVQRFYAIYMFHKCGLNKAQLKKYTSNVKKEDYFDVIKIVWYNAKKSAINSIATAVISQVGVLLSSGLLGVVTTASYGLCNQIFTTTIALGRIANTTFVPKYAYLRLQNDYHNLRRYYSLAETCYWGICCAMMVAMCVGGIPLVNYFKPDMQLEYQMVILIGITFYLEGNAQLNMTMIDTSNNIPYVTASVITSVGVVLSNFVFLKFTNWGIYGIIISKLLVQLAYMDWKWAVMVLSDLKLSCVMMFRYGVSFGVSILKGALRRKQNG